jgi:hypothetical protein
MSARQELFESMRAAAQGRIRDEQQLREIADALCDEAVRLRQRVARAVSYARKGLRLEAAAEAQASPSVFSLAEEFRHESAEEWRNLCERESLPKPEQVPADSLAEIEEAIAFTAPLATRLARMRVLVLEDAPAWDRLEVLRQLVSRDPDNPAWQDDLAALEPVAAEELRLEVDGLCRAGRLADASGFVDRLEDGKWRWRGAGRVASQAREVLERAQGIRGAANLHELTARLRSERSLENLAGAREELERFRQLERKLVDLGADVSAEDAAVAAEVARWIEMRDGDEAARRAHQDRASELDQLVHDDRSTLGEIRRAVRASEQTVGGVPADIMAHAERRIEELEQSRRRRWVAGGTVAATLAAAVAYGGTRLWRHFEDSSRIGALAAAAEANVDKGNLVEAEENIKAAEVVANGAADPRVLKARESLADANRRRDDSSNEFKRLLDAAGTPGSPDARPEKVEEAMKFAVEDEQRSDVARWKRDFEHAKALRSAERSRSGIAAVDAVRDEVVNASPGTDPSWDGLIAQWESRLKDIGNEHRDTPEVQRAIGEATKFVEAQRAKVRSGRDAADRSVRLGSIATKASAPATLAAELEAFVRAHPDAPEAGGFSEAASMREAWESVVAFATLQPKPAAGLATAPQPARDAAVAAIDRYRSQHPQSPFGAECDAFKALMQPAPAWRVDLAETLSKEVFGYWMIETNDGTRWYSKVDPRDQEFQASTGSGQTKSVMVITKVEASVKGQPPDQPKEGILTFNKSAIRFEGPSSQRAMAERLRKEALDPERGGNDVDAFIKAVSIIDKSTEVDGILLALVARSLVEKAMPEMPEPLRADLARASADLARIDADSMGWAAPAVFAARERSRKAAAEVRRALAADAWRRAYAAAVEAAAAPFGRAFRCAGVLLKDGDAPRFARAPGIELGARATLSYVQQAIGQVPSAVITVGTVDPDGTVTWDTAAARVPAGSMLFMPARGGSR